MIRKKRFNHEDPGSSIYDKASAQYETLPTEQTWLKHLKSYRPSKHRFLDRLRRYRNRKA